MACVRQGALAGGGGFVLAPPSQLRLRSFVPPCSELTSLSGVATPLLGAAGFEVHATTRKKLSAVPAASALQPAQSAVDSSPRHAVDAMDSRDSPAIQASARPNELGLFFDAAIVQRLHAEHSERARAMSQAQVQAHAQRAVEYDNVSCAGVPLVLRSKCNIQQQRMQHMQMQMLHMQRLQMQMQQWKDMQAQRQMQAQNLKPVQMRTQSDREALRPDLASVHSVGAGVLQRRTEEWHLQSTTAANSKSMYRGRSAMLPLQQQFQIVEMQQFRCAQQLRGLVMLNHRINVLAQQHSGAGAIGGAVGQNVGGATAPLAKAAFGAHALTAALPAVLRTTARGGGDLTGVPTGEDATLVAQSAHRRAVGATRRTKCRSSKYRGVSWHKGNRRWTSQIRWAGKQYHLGSWKNELDAAKSYDAAAIEHHHGIRVKLNFPRRFEAMVATEKKAVALTAAPTEAATEACGAAGVAAEDSAKRAARRGDA